MNKLFPWLILVLYVALLFGTLSFAPSVWMSVNAKTNGALSNLLPILGIIGFGILYGILIRNKGLHARREIASLTLVAACYGVLFGKVAVVPLEQYHLAEYGMLSVLAYVALRRDGSLKKTVGRGLLLVFVVGIADELYQWYLPERFFDMRDILLNTISGLLAFALIGLFAADTSNRANLLGQEDPETI